jgi:hypothetical protein
MFAAIAYAIEVIETDGRGYEDLDLSSWEDGRVRE